MQATRRKKVDTPTKLTVDTDSLKESPGEIALSQIEGQWFRARDTPHSTAMQHNLLWKVVRIDKNAAGNPTQAWVQLFGESAPSARDPYTMVKAYLP